MTMKTFEKCEVCASEGNIARDCPRHITNTQKERKRNSICVCLRVCVELGIPKELQGLELDLKIIIR